MSQAMRPYIVRPGDYLVKLAFTFGFDAEDVWNHPRNADLRGLREDHNILAPGDVLYIPKTTDENVLDLRAGVTNVFTADVPVTNVIVRLVDENGIAIAGEPYEVRGSGVRVNGQADGDGRIAFETPVIARNLILTLPTKHQSFELMLGELDPMDVDSGLVDRLANLGYLIQASYLGSTQGRKRSILRTAISCFQHDMGLAPSGKLDPATELALTDAHIS